MLLENGLENCNCKKEACPRHGKCKECVEYHTVNPKYLPYCKREKTGLRKLFKS
ncbi:hypothetical protein [Ruminiclostridium cellobioparum]|uniref:Uncharacterized protein n=1 Tax=Ruminiclostridium cellobioparum subsp. termitidis CT1112 TaxID=1195236 RepID=S0FG72_RUMCE|nr:hypothetical protein [Ruminiclostridium cellobioparum]EMS70290.1 hypothetical protein CTER_4038 [Ruminiclostridium cellobioparum subsp. termitidis CT1112]